MMDIKHIFGSHPIFYYYGFEHLAYNVACLIDAGIKNREKICISCHQPLYDKLIRQFILFNISVDGIYFKAVKELIMANKNGGINELQLTIEKRVKEALEEGYSGIRWIGQPSYAIPNTNKADFLSWEIVLSAAFRDQRASLTCIYDFEDYLYDRRAIDVEVISESLQTHSHLLSGCTMHIL